MTKKLIVGIIMAGLLFQGMIPATAEALWGSSPEKLVPKEGALRIPVDTISGQARFFEVAAADGTTVTFFVVKSRDGVIRTALNACDVCYEAGKGYAQQGEYMVCLNCGRRFLLERVNAVSGGCNPVSLGNRIEKGEVVIFMKDINDTTRYFKNVK
ncbi:MAG: DUF2318 domain-containing protein [Deltaproteobacteria bacterium]|nr:DUF2318 domain-containing protein [Deltaproteobacteria bacterium]